LWICCNFLKRTCAQNQRELAKVWPFDFLIS
jgi:hypothetical protein